MAYPKVDLKGFEREVWNIRAILYRSLTAFVLYSPEKGFIFRKELTDDLEMLIFEQKIIFIGCYKKPLKSADLVEDLEFVLSIDQEKAA